VLIGFIERMGSDVETKKQPFWGCFFVFGNYTTYAVAFF